VAEAAKRMVSAALALKAMPANTVAASNSFFMLKAPVCKTAYFYLVTA
jgi:hypothetical protein